MAQSLKNRVAIITGASRGIGRECALTLAKAGVNIVVCAKSTEDAPNLPGTIYSVAKEVEALGAKALPVKCDVRVDADLENVVKATIDKFGRVDIVINNAGALWWKNVEDTPLKRYDLINQVNSRASFALSSLCLPYMLKQKWGHVITMSPPIDFDMLKGKVAYCISKFGMTLLAMGLAQETAGKGVASNALWPATMVESFATINFALGERSSWRKASILADAVLEIVKEDPNLPSGRALIDEDFLRSKGVTDFSTYRCDPNIEPPRMTKLPFEASHNVGLVGENAARARL